MQKILEANGVKPEHAKVICDFVIMPNKDLTQREFAENLKLFGGYLVSIANKLESRLPKTQSEIIAGMARIQMNGRAAKTIQLENKPIAPQKPIQKPNNGGQGARLKPVSPINPKGPPSNANDLDLILNLSK